MRRFLFLIFLAGFAWNACLAQSQKPAPTVSPSPAASPAPPTASPSINSDNMVSHMQFPGTDVRSVLAFYEQLTGKKVVYDNTVTGTIYLVVNKPVSKEEAIKLIEINLQLNGFAIASGGPNIIKVTGLAKNPRSTGVPVYTDPAAIPQKGNQIITLLYSLTNADAKELGSALTAYINPPPPYASVVPLPESNALLITENADVVRNLVKVLSQLDVPSPQVVSEFIPLQRANVMDVMNELQPIFTSSTAATAPQRRQPEQQRGRQNNHAETNTSAQGITFGGGQVSSEDSVVVGKTRLVPDVRTNQILVITRPINIPFLTKLIQKFDVETPFGSPAKRPLKYVSALDILDTIAGSIAAPGEKIEPFAQNTNPTNNANNNRGGTTRNTNSSTSSTGGGVSFQSQLTPAIVDTNPKGVRVGNTKIIADPRENSILVVGNRDVEQKVMKLLDQIDVRAPEVMLNAVIGELTVNNNQQFGVDYLFDHNNGSILSANKSIATTTGSSGTTGTSAAVGGPAVNLTGAGQVLTASNFTGIPLVKTASNIYGAGSGLTAAIGAANSLDIIVNALQQTGRFHITNRPMVFTSNNKEAIIASGQEIAVPTTSLTSLDSTTNGTAAVSSSVEYKEVALQLDVVPLINSEKEVNLDILQQLNSLVPNADRLIGGNSIPTISTRYIRTNVTVPNLATVVLGGLVTTTHSNNASGVPVLSKIPVLGYLFKNTTKVESRNELIVLIRPTVISGNASLKRNSDAEQQRLIIQPDINSTIDNTIPRAEPVYPQDSKQINSLQN